MSDRDFFDDPDSPPPPAYEFTQQEFDQKIAHALETSQNDQQQQRPAEGGEDEWETWDEAAFNAAAARLQALNLGGSSTPTTNSSSTSGSGKAPIPSNSYGPEVSSSSSAKQRVAADVSPLRIVKKSTKEKERPSWYAEAQLDGPSSSAAPPSGSRPLPAPSARSTPRRRDTRTPEREPTPPPMFTEIGPNLDGPPYQPYEPAEPTNRGVVMTYVPGDSNPPSPLASPTISAPPASFASYAPVFGGRSESPNRRRSLPRPPSQGSMPPRTPPVIAPAPVPEVRAPISPPPAPPVHRASPAHPPHPAPYGLQDFKLKYGNPRITFDPNVAYTGGPNGCSRTEYRSQPDDDEQIMSGNIDAAAFYNASVAAQYTASRATRALPSAPAAPSWGQPAFLSPPLPPRATSAQGIAASYLGRPSSPAPSVQSSLSQESRMYGRTSYSNQSYGQPQQQFQQFQQPYQQASYQQQSAYQQQQQQPQYQQSAYQPTSYQSSSYTPSTYQQTSYQQTSYQQTPYQPNTYQPNTTYGRRW